MGSSTDPNGRCRAWIFAEMASASVSDAPAADGHKQAATAQVRSALTFSRTFEGAEGF